MDERHRKAIELLVYTDLNYQEIADEIGISRITLYEWRRQPEFKAEVDREMEIRLELLRESFKRDADKVYDRLLKIVTDKKSSDRDVINAGKFILEHTLGKAVSKHEVEAKTELSSNLGASEEDILALFDEIN